MKNILFVTHAHILYGMPMADVNSASAQPFKFGGKELEREGGADFYDFEARRLDFALGRFTSPDPLCEQTPEVSPYAYCAADPVNFIDPTGEDVVVLLEEGFIGHLGMLIQNENGNIIPLMEIMYLSQTPRLHNRHLSEGAVTMISELGNGIPRKIFWILLITQMTTITTARRGMMRQPILMNILLDIK